MLRPLILLDATFLTNRGFALEVPLGRSWGFFGSLLAILVALLGCSWALLGRSWMLLGRSWAAKHQMGWPSNLQLGPAECAERLNPPHPTGVHLRVEFCWESQ